MPFHISPDLPEPISTPTTPRLTICTHFNISNHPPALAPHTAGTDVTSEDSPNAAFVLNVIYVAGLLSFAVVLGIISEDISDAVYAVRIGQRGSAARGGNKKLLSSSSSSPSSSSSASSTMQHQ